MGIEIDWKTASKRSHLKLNQLKTTERTSTTNRDRRVAEFSWSMLRRAAALNGPTDIALTFADYISSKNEKAHRFEQLTSETITFIEEIERVAAAPAPVSHGRVRKLAEYSQARITQHDGSTGPVRHRRRVSFAYRVATKKRYGGD
jgi:adenylosuccinate synthase